MATVTLVDPMEMLEISIRDFSDAKFEEATSEHLQNGINVFKGLMLMEQMLRKAAYAGKFDFTDDVKAKFDSFYERWQAGAESVRTAA